jgi:hypothetical protein
MHSRQDNHFGLYALIAVSVSLIAYALTRPDGFADTAMRAQPSDQALTQSSVPAPTATVAPSPFAGGEDDEDESLDLPIDGVNDASNGDARVADIPNSMTINGDGMPVPAPPPVMSDHSITSEDEVPGAE